MKSPWSGIRGSRLPLLLLLASIFGLSNVRAAAPAQQAYVKASNTGESDFFGLHVAISGATMVVGAHEEDSNATSVNGNQDNENAYNSGAAYVFVRDGTNWTQQAYLKARNGEADDQFGSAVAISGDTIVVGALWEDSAARGVNGSGSNNNAPESGAAYVFVRNGTNWTQQAYLKASNSEAGDEFGFAVAIAGDTIVVGSARADGRSPDNDVIPNSGAAYVFVRNGTNWRQQAFLKAPNPGSDDGFGWAVAIAGDTAVVGVLAEDSSARGVNGSPNNENPFNSNSGAAYVFARSGTNWSQQAYLKASNSDAGDLFGASVAVDADTVVVGALGESSKARRINGDQADNSARNAGAAYVFTRHGTNWSQQAYLKAFNAEAGDVFGHPVGISGDTLVVGAQQESGDGTNAWNNKVGSSGAAYVLARSGTNWIQHAYLKAANPGVADVFGVAVAVSGDTVVVGAYLEDSNAEGINGDQSNNNAENSGAAYIFAGLGLGVFPDGIGGYAVRSKQTPGTPFQLFRAPEVTSPWISIATNVANGLGILGYYDTNAPPSRAFYRLVEP